MKVLVDVLKTLWLNLKFEYQYIRYLRQQKQWDQYVDKSVLTRWAARDDSTNFQ